MSKNTVLSLLPIVVDIEVVQGTDNLLEFQLKDAAGNPVSIVGDTIQFTARDVPNGIEKIALSNNAAQHFDPEVGKTQFWLTRDLLITADPSGQTNWVYEVRRVLGSSLKELPYFTGELRLMPTVGRQ